MNARPHVFFAKASCLFFACALLSCGDNPETVVPPDTTAPSVAAITPTDIYHFDVTFDEEVTELSAQHAANYSLEVVSGTGVTPGDLIGVSAVLRPNRKTVSISTGVTTSGIALALSIHGVSDTHGNQIVAPVTRKFTGSNLADSVPPRIVKTWPPNGATEISSYPMVKIQLSERIDWESLYYGVGWAAPDHTIDAYVSEDGGCVTVNPIGRLEPGSTQTIYLYGLKDVAGNQLPYTSWSFTITDAVDDVRPQLMSTSPPDRATRVKNSATLALTFSEPMHESSQSLVLEPDPGPGETWWTNEGRTLHFKPDAPLFDGKQYTMFVPQNSFFDASGNGNDEDHVVVFTTGEGLGGGSIAGVVLGEAGSGAADPTGTLVFTNSTTTLQRVATAAGDHSYEIEFLPDASYYIGGILDSNRDGNYDPYFGDAFGGYGLDPGASDFEPDSVTISGESHVTGIDFPLYDPSAVVGTFSYEGTLPIEKHSMYVGLFKADGFDPLNPGIPIVTGYAYWNEWFFEPYGTGVPDGDYYLFSYSDLNGNDIYEPGIDPAGMYGGFDFPTVLHVSHGADFLNLVIPIQDPIAPGRIQAAQPSWPMARRNVAFERFCESIRISASSLPQTNARYPAGASSSRTVDSPAARR